MTATTTPLPKLHGPYNMPRRAYTDQRHPVEEQIAKAEAAVEGLGADRLLTNALSKLQEARSLVADWLEGATG